MAIFDLLVQCGPAVLFAWAFVVQAGMAALAILMLVAASARSGSAKTHLLLAIAAVARGGSFTGTAISLPWRRRFSSGQGESRR